MAPLPLEYLRRILFALFNLQEYIPYFYVLSSGISLIDLSTVTMGRFNVATMMVCFELNGTPMEIMDQAKVKEVFVAGIGKLALHVTLDEPVATKDGPSLEERTKKGSPREDVSMIGGSVMVLDEEQRLEQRMKRPREVKDKNNGPLIFKHRKQARMGDIVEALEDEEDL